METRLTAGQLTRVLDVARRCLAQEHIPYMVIGALALGPWGRPRGTLDADLMCLVHTKRLPRLKAHFRAAGFQEDRRWARENPLLHDVQVRLRHGGVRLDLMLPRDRHDRAAFRRRRAVKLSGRRFWVMSPEDLILQKLKVGRPRDLEDAGSVMVRLGRRLNRRYVFRWARQLGLLGQIRWLFQQTRA